MAPLRRNKEVTQITNGQYLYPSGKVTILQKHPKRIEFKKLTERMVHATQSNSTFLVQSTNNFQIKSHFNNHSIWSNIAWKISIVQTHYRRGKVSQIFTFSNLIPHYSFPLQFFNKSNFLKWVAMFFLFIKIYGSSL